MESHKNKHNKVVFKPYNQYQLELLPPTWDAMVAQDHPVRTVNQIIDKLELKSLIKSYRGGGTSSYHPKMLLKVLVFAYLNNIYSSRKIEAALKENINFMWLSGRQYPDHNTINNFRSKRLTSSLKDIFKQVCSLLVAEGFLDIENTYTDGTKLEANANRYSFVWAKSIANYKIKIEERLEELWAYTEKVYAKEKKQAPKVPSFKAIDQEKINQTAAAINEVLADKEIAPKLDKEVKKN